MSILNNLRKAHAAIVLDQTKRALQPNNPDLGKLGGHINELAVDALTHGLGSDAWTDYMTLFASNPAELAQLADPAKTEGVAGAAWLRQMRAYIVSNAICDIGTNGKTFDKVTADVNIAEDQANEEFIKTRKVAIPDVVE
ncbi:MAG TPA: hypothetical protein VGD41_04610 [Pyrinomonadaceae bacterium]